MPGSAARCRPPRRPSSASSPWWAWPLDLKPTYWYFGTSTGGNNGYIYDAGNILLFWAALPAAAIVAGLAIRARSASLAMVTLAMLTQLVAWIPISRVLFFYHFFTVLPFYLLCLAVVLALLWERRRMLVLGFIAAAAVVFVAFYPYVSGVPVPGQLGAAYQILPTWQYDPAFWNTDSCPTPVSQNIATSLTVGVAWLYELAALHLHSLSTPAPVGKPILISLAVAAVRRRSIGQDRRIDQGEMFKRLRLIIRHLLGLHAFPTVVLLAHHVSSSRLRTSQACPSGLILMPQSGRHRHDRRSSACTGGGTLVHPAPGISSAD